MDGGTHKLLDTLQHIWPFLAGVLASIIGVFKFWWADRKALRERIQNIEVLAEQAVTHAHLETCRQDVAIEDKAILQEIKAIREDMREDNNSNALAHQKIIENSNRSQQELMKAILHLHTND